MPRALYLDHNATTPLRPEATDAVVAGMEVTGNPSSVHRFGRAARRVVEEARFAVAELAGVDPSSVVFTSGATEANWAALSGAAVTRRLVSAIEHPSVLAAEGCVPVPVTRAGVIDLEALEGLLAAEPGPALVSVMAANNETGVIQPVAEVAAIAHGHGAMLHCDAVQAAGRLPLAPITGQAALVSLSAHKLGGPRGVGALIVGADAGWQPLLRGGGQELRRRAGTEAVASIAGFGAAARAASNDLDQVSRVGTLRDGMEDAVLADCADAVVHGRGSARLANTACISMPGVAAETQVMAFDLAGIAVSAGAACSSGKVTSSHVLTAMGVPEDQASTAIRVSLGLQTRPEDIDRFVAEWRSIRARAGQPAFAAA